MLSRRHSSFWCAFLLLSQACSPFRHGTVEFAINRWPLAKYEGMRILGVSRTKGLRDKFTNYLVGEMRHCKHYRGARNLEQTFAIPIGERSKVVDFFDKTVVDSGSELYVDGILNVQLLQNTWNVQSHVEPITMLKENSTYEWQDAIGYAAHPGHYYYSHEEAAPETSLRVEKTRVFKRDYRLAARFLLYNVEKGELVFDLKTSLSFAVSHYSEDPPLSAGTIRTTLMKQLVERIYANACPEHRVVERNLYALGDETHVDNLNYRGMELADDGKWRGASEAWKKVITLDKSNVFAHNNLGVFYEQKGDLEKALAEYKQAETGKDSKSIKDSNFDRLIKTLTPFVPPEELEPRVHTVTNNLWVTIFTPGGGLEKGLALAVYDADPVTPESDGAQLREVGKVRVEFSMPPYSYARVTEYLTDRRIRPGNIVVVPEEADASETD